MVMCRVITGNNTKKKNRKFKTYCFGFCTTWYPNPAAALLQDSHATGSILKQREACSTKKQRRRMHMLFMSGQKVAKFVSVEQV